MKIFISGETDANLGYYEALRVINPLKDKVAQKNYGSALSSLVIVPMIMSDEGYSLTWFNEMVGYYPKQKEAEARLKTDYETYKNASSDKKALLLLDNIIRSIRAVAQHIPEGFDASLLESDILAMYDVQNYEQLQEKLSHTT